METSIVSMETTCQATGRYLLPENRLQFFGDLQPLRDPQVFARYPVPWKKQAWVVYAPVYAKPSVDPTGDSWQ